MGKNVRLADIYIKIHNKKPLTMDDLIFLSKYDRECFEKTCKNLIYNVPETEKLMQSDLLPETEKRTEEPIKEKIKETTETSESAELMAVEKDRMSESDKIEVLLKNLSKMEQEEFAVQQISAESVKNLLGSLYMEMLFPHNDRNRYFEMEYEEGGSKFNKKA